MENKFGSNNKNGLFLKTKNVSVLSNENKIDRNKDREEPIAVDETSTTLNNEKRNDAHVYYDVFKNFYIYQLNLLNFSKNPNTNSLIADIFQKEDNNFERSADRLHHILENIVLTTYQRDSEIFSPTRDDVINGLQDYDKNFNTEFFKNFSKKDNISELNFIIVAFFFGLNGEQKKDIICKKNDIFCKNYIEYFVASGYLRHFVNATSEEKYVDKFVQIASKYILSDNISKLITEVVGLPFVKKLIRKKLDFDSFENFLTDFFNGIYALPLKNKTINEMNIKSIDEYQKSNRNFYLTAFLLCSSIFETHYKEKSRKKWLADNNIRNLIPKLIGLADSNINLRFANLSNVNFSGLDLRRVNLVGSDLTKANLTATDLEGVDLSEIDLTATDLTRANLVGANLQNSIIEAPYLGTVSVMKTKLVKSLYDEKTMFPDGFKPEDAGMMKVNF